MILEITMKRKIILVVDPDQQFLSEVKETVTSMGHRATCTRMLAAALQFAVQDKPDVIILNVEMPDGRGIDRLAEFVQAPFMPEVIVISDLPKPDEAEQAIRNGAWDYVEKPGSGAAMNLPILRALEYRAKKRQVERRFDLREETLQHIAGRSARLKASLELVASAANSEASVLITGETGTGKELFAWAIHNNSARAGNQFVVVDCASLPISLVESTLFGYEKGAFTGADRPHKGLIKRADGGTLFLDEVGELPLSVQKSFLRVLQERKFRQVGGKQEVRSNFRLIAATNRNLDHLVQQRQFRKDLLFRLRSFGIDLPPLRERTEDIPSIAQRHMEEFYDTYNTEPKDFSPDFFSTIARYDWPGNVRELVNALERAISVAGDEPILFPKHLPTYIRIQLARARVCKEESASGGRSSDAELASGLPTMKEVRETAISAAEEKYLRDLIESTRGNLDEARRVSGLSRARLYGLLKKYGITRTPALGQD